MMVFDCEVAYIGSANDTVEANPFSLVWQKIAPAIKGLAVCRPGQARFETEPLHGYSAFEIAAVSSRNVRQSFDSVQ